MANVIHRQANRGLSSRIPIVPRRRSLSRQMTPRKILAHTTTTITNLIINCFDRRRNGLKIGLRELPLVVGMVDVRPDIVEPCLSKEFSIMDNTPLVDYFDIDAFLDDCECLL